MSDGTPAAGALHLIPTLLGAGDIDWALPEHVKTRIRSIDAFVAENAKSARQFLKCAGYARPLSTVPICELNQHTPASALPQLLDPVRKGMHLGLLSEAGCPAVADPGAALVALAHEQGVRVIPLVGPSSILLALMASGLNGQRFCFHGYLPVERDARIEAIRQLETVSRREAQTQVFIEAPYRNARLLEALLQACQVTTRLCLATDLMLPGETVRTRSIAMWREGAAPVLDRRPTVFLLQAN